MTDNKVISMNAGKSFASRSTLDNSGGPPHDSDMSNLEPRIAHIEGQMDGLKGQTNLMMGAMAILVAVVLGGFAIVFSQISALDDKVDALPEKISNEVREANRAFSDALSTSLQVFKEQQAQRSQQPPNIIVNIPDTTKPETK